MEGLEKKLVEEKEEKKGHTEKRQSNMCPCKKLHLLNLNQFSTVPWEGFK